MQQNKDGLYRGDSPGKKIARVYAWWRILSAFPNKHLNGRFLVLAGDGGDLATLTAMQKTFQLDLARVVAVDVDAEAVKHCRMRFPQVEVVHGDVVDVAFRLRKQCGVVFLDWCSNICEAKIAETARVIKRCAALGTYVALGFKRGREHAKTTVKIDESEEKLRAYAQANNLDLDEDSWIDRRGGYLDERLAQALFADGLFPMTRGACWYHSGSDDRVGSPMLYRVAVLVPSGAALNTAETAGKDVAGIDVPTWRRFITQYLMPGSAQFLDLRDRKSEEDVKKYVLRYLSELPNTPSKELAQLLNVDPGKIAAWKAHRTMGTY